MDRNGREEMREGGEGEGERDREVEIERNKMK